MLKRIISMVLATMLLCTALITGVSAAEYDPTEDFEGYIRFVDSNKRIASDGTFEFELNYSLTSGRFTANGTSITIETTAQICMWDGTGKIVDDNDEQYTVTLYHEVWIFTMEVGSYTGTCNNKTSSKTFTNLTKGDTYFFKINPVNANLSMTAKHIKGTGIVSDVTVK